VTVVDSNNYHNPLANVPLCLADSRKSVETAPNGIIIGMIKLHSWQLHLVEPVPSGFEGHAAYLIRANYEFDIAPEVPAPAWAEVDFQFGGNDAIVVDAVPRTITRAARAAEYELTEKLSFLPVRRGGSAGRPIGVAADRVVLPPVQPRIDCFGLGGDNVRWRHSGTVPVGSHTGWFALLTPLGCTEVHVVAGGEYHVDTDSQLKLRPASRRDAFSAQLPESAAVAVTATGRTAKSARLRVLRTRIAIAQASRGRLVRPARRSRRERQL
jgi:hypothetical protein